MKKNVFVYWIVLFLLIVGFNGCIDLDKENNVIDQDVDLLMEDDYIIEIIENDSINNSILVDVINKESIKVKIVSGEKLGCSSLSYSFKAILLDGNSNYKEYYWDFGDNTNSTERNTDHIYENMGKYLVVLTVFDDIGNIGIAEKELNVVSSVCYICKL